MMRASALLATALLVALPRAAAADPGEVKAISVMSGSGRVHVVIDVHGGVNVSDFMLANPIRLVVDVRGATLAAGSGRYDGVNRGGIQNLRYAQFAPDVVRIVLELESIREYRIEQDEGSIRISLGTDRQFAAWSSLASAWSESTADASPYATRAPTQAPATYLPNVQQSQQPSITVTYDSAHIADVMAGLSEFSGRSIVLGRSVTGYVTAQIRNQPWDVAFRTILDANGLSAFEEESGIIRVDSRDVIAARDSTEPLRTTLVRLNYARASDLVEGVVAIMSSRGRVVAEAATNSLIITDVESRIRDDSVFVSRLDIRTPQVSIHAKLIFVDRTDIENLGVRYDLGTSEQFFNRLVQRRDPASAQPVDTDGDGVPDQTVATEFFDPGQNIINLGGNALSALANADAAVPGAALQLIFSTAIGAFNLTSFIDALQQVQLADLQAEPVISTSDNTEAYILVGERTPIRTIDASSQQGDGTGAPRASVEIVPTGITLRVTPHVTSNRQVLMQLRAENSSVQVAPGDIGLSFATQEAQNQILVNDGETAVIGGLTVTQVSVAKSGIPFLVDLPLIGRIFGFTSRREQRRDLLILVTPHIIDDATGTR
ncbi:MAG: AMIN domain-containing protein [Gemmatimonadales bacterium]